jgi:hypothetical protein
MTDEVLREKFMRCIERMLLAKLLAGVTGEHLDSEATMNRCLDQLVDVAHEYANNNDGSK